MRASIYWFCILADFYLWPDGLNWTHWTFSLLVRVEHQTNQCEEHFAISTEMVMAGRCFAPASESSCAARPWPPWGYPAPEQPPSWPLTSMSAEIHSTVADAFPSAAQSSCGLPLPSSGGECFQTFTSSQTTLVVVLSLEMLLCLSHLCFRFGSFEIFLGRDNSSGLQGPSAGRHDIRAQLLDYVIETFYPCILQTHSNRKDRNMAFFREVNAIQS